MTHGKATTGSSLVLLHGHEKIGHPFGNGGPLSIDLPFSEIIG
jgi:hypothetical protein